MSIDKISHEIWATSQLLPHEGIEDGVLRIKSILSYYNNCIIKDNNTDECQCDCGAWFGSDDIICWNCGAWFG